MYIVSIINLHHRPCFNFTSNYVVTVNDTFLDLENLQKVTVYNIIFSVERLQVHLHVHVIQVYNSYSIPPGQGLDMSYTI